MKEAELANHLTCSLCGKLFTHTGLPLFWRVTIDRFGVDAQAARQQVGLSMMVGSMQIARAMGLDEDIAQPMMEPVTLTVCETCACERALPIAAMAIP